MPTCGQLLDECSAQLHGWGSTQDRATPLSNSILNTDLSFTVDFTTGVAVGISPGVVEIDSELIWVVSVDQGTGICVVADGGRGYQGTTAAAHAANTRVVTRPKFPRAWLFRQMNEILGGVYPDLFKVNTYTATVTYPSNTYQLPTTPPFNVLQVQWKDPIGNWQDAFSFKIDPYDATLRLGDGPMVGRPLRALYTTEPGQFTAETDDFVTVTGLPSSCIDVLTLGVVAKQAPGLDISRAQSSSVEQSDRSRVVPPFAGVNVAKYLMAEYQQRLANEASALKRQYPTRLVRVW